MKTLKIVQLCYAAQHNESSQKLDDFQQAKRTRHCETFVILEVLLLELALES